MKKALLTLLLATMMSCTLLGCESTSGNADRNTRTEKEKDGDKDKDKDKDKKKNKDKKKDKNNQEKDVSYDLPEEYIDELCKNIAYTSMMSGEWEENPDYVFESSDYSKYFMECNDENYIPQLLLTDALMYYSGERDVFEAENGVNYDLLCDEEAFSEFLHLMYGVEEFPFEDYEVADLTNSGLYHADGNMYVFNGVVADMSAHFSRTYTNDRGSMICVYVVSNQLEDGTPISGEIHIVMDWMDCMGWYLSLSEVRFVAD